MAFSDIFKLSEFKAKIEALSTENTELTQELKLSKEKADVKLNIQQMQPIELENKISAQKIELKNLTAKIANVSTELQEKHASLEDLKAEVGELEADKEMSSYGLYKPHYDFATSLEYKDQLKEIRDEQKSAIRSKTAVEFNPNWLVNDSKTAGRKMNRNNIKAILRSFNNECTDAIKKVTYSNYERIRSRIEKSFDQHNKMYEVVDIRMNYSYLDLKFQELNLAFEYANKKEDERESLREQREAEREDKALQREIQKQRKTLSKEIDHYEQAVNELSDKLNTSNADNPELQAEIDKLRRKLDALHDDQDDLDFRENNATAGYVYIISNIGSFGKDVVKIGVTRRLEPLDRIRELSSASVPFKFDVHALIFSEDAYSLETKLHKRFDKNRINKVNNRKEYFKISIDEIEKELKKYKNVTVDFHENAEAPEYRQTLALENNISNNSDYSTSFAN
ncbi:DUF4041 domain-containing protein [Secundilactobacillus similis DSM 23365 = JCM 2765]|nr:DUF4041 domain-containing protein [Secundilactobacillus similis]